MDLKACQICGKPGPFRNPDNPGEEWFCLDHTPRFSYPPTLEPYAIEQMIERLRSVVKFVKHNGRLPANSEEIISFSKLSPKELQTNASLEPKLARAMQQNERIANSLESGLPEIRQAASEAEPK